MTKVSGMILLQVFVYMYTATRGINVEAVPIEQLYALSSDADTFGNIYGNPRLKYPSALTSRLPEYHRCPVNFVKVDISV